MLRFKGWGAGVGVGALVAGIAVGAFGPLPAMAAGSIGSSGPVPSEARRPANRIVSQASGSALTVAITGQKQGSGEFVAEHDGIRLHTQGRNQPLIPLLDGRRDVVGGALGQDATAARNGRSAACAGVVGRNGSVEVGEHDSCLVTGNGRISLSLGTLDELGLEQVLGKLPELPQLPGAPDLALPAMELRIEGRALTAKCQATPSGTRGQSSPLRAQVVAIVDGRRIPIVDLPQAGGGIGLDDILDKLPAGLPPELSGLLKQVLEALPEGVPSNDLIQITPNLQIRDQGRLTVTALRVVVAQPALADITAGTVSCGPNVLRTLPRTPPKPSPKPTATPDPTAVPTAVPAGLASVPGESSAAAPTTAAKLGWGTAVVVLLTGLIVGGYLHRRRG